MIVIVIVIVLIRLIGVSLCCAIVGGGSECSTVMESKGGQLLSLCGESSVVLLVPTWYSH